MIGMRTILEVADNSGARRLSCILPRGGDLGLRAGLGDVVTAAVKEAAPDSSIKKGKVVRCVIVRMRKETRRTRWQLHPVRFECRRADQRSRRAGGNARVRTRGPRAARQEIHEDRLARPGGDLTMSAQLKKDKREPVRIQLQQERSGEGDRRPRQGQDRARSRRRSPPRAASWSSTST